MAASMIVLHLMCLLLWEEVNFAQLSVLEQQRRFIMADVGDNVTLPCFHLEDFKTVHWYKQHLGEKPELLVSRSKYNKEPSLSENLKNNPRFSVVSLSGEGINTLNISDLRLSDSAVYYCGMQMYSDIQFKEGITLRVRGSSSSIQVIVQQPPEKKPGDSVNLNCTVDTAVAYHCAVASNNRSDDEERDCRDQMDILVFLSICRTGFVLSIVLVFTIAYMARKYTCHIEER